MGAVLQASETLFLLLKLAGAAYLVYLGVKLMLSRTPAREIGGASERLAPLALVWQGVLSNVTNPKMVLFFLAFLPQFVSPASAHPTRDLVFLGMLYAFLALPIKVGVGLAAGTLAQRMARSNWALAWLNRVGGMVLVLVGLRIAALDR